LFISSKNNEKESPFIYSPGIIWALLSDHVPIPCARTTGKERGNKGMRRYFKKNCQKRRNRRKKEKERTHENKHE
jgi:hypothetical protein